MTRNSHFLLLILFLFQFNVQAQTKYSNQVKGNSVNTGQVITALVIRSADYSRNFINIKVDGDTLKVLLDTDAPKHTYFISLEQKYQKNQILILDDGDFEIIAINSGTAPKINSAHRKEVQENCELGFSEITQEEWRSGLPAPNYSRSFTRVNHVVIHHSAGSNSNTNFTQVVRDIYIYHTEVNGWSDIGYNYLIAQNGEIYTGRDPEGGAQDNVRGAHFCGSNTGTMGVCLLGNYETAVPSPETWSSLQTVAAFKLDKEGLAPTDKSQHTLGLFESIIGHRDGCSTLCPGENVYNQLIDLRSEIADQIESCGDKSLAFLANRRSVSLFQEVTFFNSSEGYDSYQWLIPGAEPTSADWQMSGTTMYTQAGIFGVSLIGLINGISLDTLTLENYIEVEKGAIVAPNPVASNESITIQSENVFSKINLYTLLGDEFLLKSVNGINTFSIPDLESGVYILKIPFGKNFKEEKIIVL